MTACLLALSAVSSSEGCSPLLQQLEPASLLQLDRDATPGSTDPQRSRGAVCVAVTSAHLEQFEYLEHFTAWMRWNWTGLGCIWLRRESSTCSLEPWPSFLRASVYYEVIGATL